MFKSQVTKFSSVLAALSFASFLPHGEIAVASPTSLTDMSCSSTNRSYGSGDSWRAVSTEVVIGREIFESVAFLQYRSGIYTYSGYIPEEQEEFAGTACRITPPGATPRFDSLRLAFGLNSEHRSTNSGTLVRLDIFVDGNQVDSVQISESDPGYSIVDVSNARSIALEGHCLDSGQGNACPSIAFVQALLE